MFGLFKKDEKATLQKEYEKLMKQAIDAQRNGNIELFGELSAKAEEIAKKIDELK